MHLEARFVETISHDGKHILDQREEILLVERLSNIWSSSNVLQEFVKNLKPSIRDIPLSVLHSPYNRVYNQFLVLWWNVEKRRETVLIDHLGSKVEKNNVSSSAIKS
jgi:hypothetical protein